MQRLRVVSGELGARACADAGILEGPALAGAGAVRRLLAVSVQSACLRLVPRIEHDNAEIAQQSADPDPPASLCLDLARSHEVHGPGEIDAAPLKQSAAGQP